MKSVKNTIKKTTVLLAILSVCACSTTSTTSKMNIVQVGDSISIVKDLNKNSTVLVELSKGQATIEDATSGASTGAVAGAAYGLLCGPMFWLCSPAFALAGAAGGGVVGASVSSLRESDLESNTLLLTKINSYLQINDPQEELLIQVIKSAKQTYQVSASSKSEIAILINRIGLDATSDGKILLEVNAKITLKYYDKSGKQKKISRDYEYISNSHVFNTWLEGGDDFYELKLKNAYYTLSDNIVRAL